MSQGEGRFPTDAFSRNWPKATPSSKETPEHVNRVAGEYSRCTVRVLSEYWRRGPESSRVLPLNPAQAPRTQVSLRQSDPRVCSILPSANAFSRPIFAILSLSSTCLPTIPSLSCQNPFTGASTGGAGGRQTTRDSLSEGNSTRSTEQDGRDGSGGRSPLQRFAAVPSVFPASPDN